MMKKFYVSSDDKSTSLTSDAIANSISEFCYVPESGLTFEAWFKRYDDLFAKDCNSWDEGAKVRLLLRKLGVSEHEKYCNFVLPKKPTDFSWSENSSMFNQDIWRKVVTLPHALPVFSNCEGPE